jgi:hypothetical protein
MAARRRPSKSSSPLDERQRKLLEEQEQLRQRVEQCNRVIEEAPRLKAERARAQRDELLIDRSTRAHHRLNTTTLADTRYEQHSGAAPSRARRRPLKAERRQTRIIFFGYLLALAVLIFWLLRVWHWQWPN